MLSKKVLLISSLSIVLLVTANHYLHADTTLPLVNPSFEDGLKGWTLEGGSPDFAKVVPEAASLGNMGLRIQSPAGSPEFTVSSTPLPVTAGKTYSVKVWAGGGGEAKGGNVAVELVFKGSDGKELKPGMASIRKWPAGGISGGRFFGDLQLAAAAPEGAATLTVRIKGKAGPTGAVDVDDFKVEELDDKAPAATAADGTPAAPASGVGVFHPVPPSDSAYLEALLKEIAANPYRGKSPPKIVIKLDDLKPSNGGVHAKWLKVADYAKSKNIKVAFGIICNGMEVDSPKFYEWVKEQNASGAIEFWCHGYDHGEDKKAGTQEFNKEPYEYQKEHLTKCQALAKEKLGFAFVSFGAPFNGIDKVTAQVMSEDPDMKVWMYGDAKDTGGKFVLERCGVGIENPTLIPNYGAFLDNYAHNRGAEYFCMQGHPAGWGDDRWEQFTKTVEFLIGQKADFVQPRDFASNKPASTAAPAPTEPAKTP